MHVAEVRLAAGAQGNLNRARDKLVEEQMQASKLWTLLSFAGRLHVLLREVAPSEVEFQARPPFSPRSSLGGTFVAPPYECLPLLGAVICRTHCVVSALESSKTVKLSQISFLEKTYLQQSVTVCDWSPPGAT
jgi:hypothetical protein